jgi:hypothetical protein
MGMAFALGFALFSRTSQSVTADKVADLRNMFQDAYTGWLEMYQEAAWPRIHGRSETASQYPTGVAGGLSRTSAFGRRLPEYVSVTDMKIEIKSSHALQFRLVVHMPRLPRPAPATPS